ncbi:1851_t:CDS:2, partial [Acaulospora colombiana]
PKAWEIQKPGILRIQTNLQQVDVNKYIFEIPDAATINHIVVLLLGTIPFEPGFAATVHFLWPGGEQGWKLLGMLSNDKPSAIFRLRGTAVPGVTSNVPSFGLPKLLPNYTEEMSMDDNDAPSASPVTATLGISIEQIAMVESQIATLRQTSNQQPSTTTEVSQIPLNILKNLYNYVTSFATSSTPFNAQIIGTGNTYISIKVFQDWYDLFLRKVKADPNIVLKGD